MTDEVTIAEYRRICERIARKAVRFAAEKVGDEAVATDNVTCPKCERPPRQPCKFPVWAPDNGPGRDDAPKGFVHNERAAAALDAQTEHWIDVYLDDRLPDIDPEVLLGLTAHVDAFDKGAGHAAQSPAIAAVHAFQADIWDAINRMETDDAPSTPAPAARPIVTIAEHVTGLELRVEVKLLGYVVEHYTGVPDHARAVAKIKASEVEAVATELLKDRGWEKTDG